MKGHLSLVLVATLLAVPATVQAEEPEIRIAAHDDPDACGGDPPCLEDVDGSWGVVYAGDTIEVTFVNEGERTYALAIVPASERSQDGETGTGEAFLETGPVEPGETTTSAGTVPGGTDQAYLFEETHESEGMHLVREVYPAESKYEGEPACPPGNETNETADDGSDPGPCEDRGNEEVDNIPLGPTASLLALAGAVGLRRRD